ncbi:LOW QUALITY PROTEIN: hypothetical protein CFOL_v3_26014, partial [Cephalotus follicularis]
NNMAISWLLNSMTNEMGEMSTTDYFNALSHYWQLDILEDTKCNCPIDSQQYRKILEKERTYKFLLGLNKELDKVRERILSIKPLPSIHETFSEVRRGEIDNSYESNPVTNEQIDLLQELLQKSIHNALKPVGMANTAQKGNSFVVFSAGRGNSEAWIVDSGASDHMTEDSSVFSTY